MKTYHRSGVRSWNAERGIERRTPEASQQPTRSVGVPWEALGDGLGWAVAVAVASVPLDVASDAGRSFVAWLALGSLFAWISVHTGRSLRRALRRPRAIVFLPPWLAAGAAVAGSRFGQGEAHLLVALLFALTWTATMAATRWAVAPFRPPLRVLLIGDPPYQQALATESALEVVRRTRPPYTLTGFDVVVTEPGVPYGEAWRRWLGHADLRDVKILPAPLFLEAMTGRVPVEMLHGRWAFEVLHRRAAAYLPWKRAFDLAVVLLAAPALLLVAGLVALTVWWDSGRPVLFWQDRIGRDGRAFRMVKFRTMRSAPEPSAQSTFASAHDPRVTRTGRLLRTYRLDELPQFWNVLRGEMSLIGPRPEQPGFVEVFEREIPLYAHRHRVPPGITGWAQVRQGYAFDVDSTRTKLCFDLYYVKHCSPALDAQIVLRTVWTMLTGFGAR